MRAARLGLRGTETHLRTLTLGGMDQAASERETRHVAPLAETIASEAQSKDGKEGGKQEAEGMGAPFGLAL